MKHVRTFETLLEIEPKVGDYVMCREQESSTDRGLKKFISENIGRVVSVKQNVNHPFYVKYLNIPLEIEYRFIDGVREFAEFEIIRFATAQEIDGYRLLQNVDSYNL